VSTVEATSLEPGLREDLADPLLRVEGLEKHFALGRALRGQAPTLRAVAGISFDVARGETLGIVGESGCGKSTAARCILRLHEPTGGRVWFDGVDVAKLDGAALRRLRRRMQIVFQDPYASLDPRMSVRAIVEEPLQIHRVGDREQRSQRVHEILELVGISSALAPRKPHAFSGGQRQRIAIARALALEPELVILDEPVTALDVSIQAQVLNLLADLQERLGLTYLFIVHDLAVAEHFCHRLAVMYRGKVVELADRDEMFRSPLHPYTTALLSAAPVPDLELRRSRERIVLRGEVPRLDEAITGCPFRMRCPVGRDRELCATQAPPLAQGRPGHWTACHFPGELQPTTTGGAPRARVAGNGDDAPE
jgi:oligopeptide/dipeptide ABC transporter ATP-binding protein